MDITIRTAKQEDVPQLLLLIKELALFERAPSEVSNTEAQMLKDGFGQNALFDAFVAERDGRIIGTAITYFRYSTWKGKCLYLEDLIVAEDQRGKGAGKLLFDACVAFGKQSGCVRMNWQVLDWNQSAMDFYAGYGTHFDNEWVNCSIHLRA